MSMRGASKRFMLAVIVSCSIMLTAQIAFQSYLLAVATEEQPYGTILANCKTTFLFPDKFPVNLLD